MTHDGSHLEAALQELYTELEVDGPGQRWKDYALRANQRGEALIDTVSNVMPRLRGRRHLDIGCGYGGVCVAAARRGAETVGVDVNPKLLKLAELNQADHPDLQLDFRLIDIMEQDKLASLGRFDVITCDNVIEHVRHPEKLIAHISRLLTPRGVVYMSIPNAFSVGQVRAECHYELFGASLLDSEDATEYLRHARDLPEYDVSVYHRFDTYLAWFERYGLSTRVLLDDRLDLGAEDSLRRAVIELEHEWKEARPGVPERVAGKLDTRLSDYRLQLSAVLDEHDRAAADSRRRLARDIRRDYVEEIWYVMGSRRAHALRWRAKPLAKRILSRLARPFQGR